MRVRLITQLIKGISRVLHELLRYFNGTIIATLFVPPLLIWPVFFLFFCFFCFFVVVFFNFSLWSTADSSLQYCHKIPDVFELLLPYYIKFCISITTSKYSALSICVLFMQLVNGTQFLNITFLLALFASAAATVVFETVIVPLTGI